MSHLLLPKEFPNASAFLAAIVDSSDDAIISKNPNGIITFWNQAAERILGYRAEEAVGKPITMIIPEDRLMEEVEIMTKLRKGERINHFETVRMAKDGHLIDLSISVSPICDREKRVVGSSKIARDITERKAMIEQLHKNLEDMEDITHIASHDLKEPLRGLIAYATFLKEDYGDKLDEEGIEKLDKLVSLSNRGYKLINELLEYSRLEKRQILVEKVDLNEIIKDISSMMEVRLKERNASIEVSGPLPSFKGDKSAVTEILRNLITNAVTYNDKPAPVVEVGFRKEMQTLQGQEKNVFYVKDNGIGIRPEFQKDVFRLFKRLESSAHYNTAGSGVGLTFVKKLIDRCHGRIWLKSEPGQGSTFYFTVSKCTELLGEDEG
jgi:PAS domain S-box-containing protein